MALHKCKHTPGAEKIRDVVVSHSPALFPGPQFEYYIVNDHDLIYMESIIGRLIVSSRK